MENNLNLYYIFYTVALHKNISGAAKELYISQPAISKAISKLEQSLDVILFHRSSRGVTLTMEGELLFTQVQTAFSAIRHGEEQLKKVNELGISQISIGVSITLCKYVLLPYLQQFVKDNPHIKVTITCHPTMETLRDIDNSVTDIGVVGIPSLPNGLTYIPFREIQDTFVTTDRYLENLKIRVGNDRKAILNNATFMMLNKENISRKYVDMYLSSHQITMDNIIEINTMDLLIELAKIDLGIACVIKDFVKDELDDHSLTEVSLGRAIPKRKLGLVYKDDTIMTDAMKKFISYFTES
ncbi:MAG TPA: LysR family transcriptional regulator [Lachnospiraceae bacterium]|jgi:transcriptional regulator, lysR family|nr:LysR family transcriptional regulator [Lachnospiraceae bacterium]